jgi:uncharacterized protein (UPF0264 family)
LYEGCPVRTPSTRLLVSVRSAAEAEAALTGGADIIDVKEPTRGPLGMADATTIAEVVTTVAGRVPVSAALGELIHENSISHMEGLTWVKVGFLKTFGRRDHLGWQWMCTEKATLPARLLPVFYADAKRSFCLPLDDAWVWRWMDNYLIKGWLLNHRAKSPHPGSLLLDTAIKDGQGLLAWYEISQLRELRRRCHELGIFLALAGSLSCDDVQRLMNEVQPDIIAVRGAACEHGIRDGRVSTEAVAALKTIIQAGLPV